MASDVVLFRRQHPTNARQPSARLSNGLRHLWPLMGGPTGMRDLVTGIPCINNGVTWEATIDERGRGGLFVPRTPDNSTVYLDTQIYLSNEMAGWGAYSIYWWVQTPTDDVAVNLIIGDRNGSNRGFKCGTSTSWRPMLLTHNGVADTGYSNTASNATYVYRSTNRWYLLGFQWDGSTVQAFQEGNTQVGSDASMASIIGQTDYTTWIGGQNDAGTLLDSADDRRLHSVMVWDRPLAAAERSALARDMFAPYALQRRVFIPGAAAGGGTTIPIFHRHYANMSAA